MALMLGKVYEVLISVGAEEDKARAAAEELASYENRFAKIEADLLLLKWMVSIAIAGITGLYFR